MSAAVFTARAGVGSKLDHFLFVPAFLICVAIVWVIPAVAPLLFLALAGWSFRSDQSAVQAITVAWLLTSLNPEIYSPSSAGLRWVVLLSAAIGLAYRMGPTRTSRWIERFPALLVVSGIAVASMVMSRYPVLSVTKYVGFLVGFFVVVAAFSRLRSERVWLDQWFSSLGVSVVLMSAPLIWTSTGFVRNGSGFQGVLNHPQTMGVFLAPFFVYFAIRFISDLRRVPDALFAVCCGAGLFVSEARTGALAAVLGFAVAAALTMASRRAEGRAARRRVAFGLALVSVLAVGFIVTRSPAEFVDFATKSRDGTLLESFEVSRGSTITDSVEAFRASPLVGQGFGVDSRLDPEDVQSILGIPIGAPVESGFAVTGLLEQVGLLGVCAFAWLLFEVLRPVAKARVPTAVGVSAAALATNLGEATISSFGGLGLLLWLLIGWSLAVSLDSVSGDSSLLEVAAFTNASVTRPRV